MDVRIGPTGMRFHVPPEEPELATRHRAGRHERGGGGWPDQVRHPRAPPVDGADLAVGVLERHRSDKDRRTARLASPRMPVEPLINSGAVGVRSERALIGETEAI